MCKKTISYTRVWLPWNTRAELPRIKIDTTSSFYRVLTRDACTKKGGQKQEIFTSLVVVDL